MTEAAETPDSVTVAVPVGLTAAEVLPVAVAAVDAADECVLKVVACSEILDCVDVASVESSLEEELVLVFVSVSDTGVCPGVNNAVDGTE